MNLALRYRSLLNSYGINTPLRLAHAFTQFDAENGGLVAKEESLYYKTIESLRKTFYTPFKGKTDEFVSQYLRNSEKCANYVYANRMGNGNEASGDGFKYRGRGFQITGKNNYIKLSKDTRIDYLSNPELLNREADAVISMCWYWKSINANKYADEDNLDAISDLINIGRITEKYGDANGFQHRKELLRKYKIEFGI